MLLRSFREFRGFHVRAVGVLALVGAVLQPGISHASSPFLTVPEPGVAESTAAYRYANMTNDEAIAELNRRGLPYVTVNDPVAGVRAPIRLTGRLHGVLIHSGSPEKQRATSPFEILDARLALALDDFTAILEKHDIDEIEHFSMYRPEVARKTADPKPAVAAAPAKDNPSLEVSPEKPVPTVGKQTPGKTGGSKVAARGKTPVAHSALKPQSKATGATKPGTKAAPLKKTTPPIAPKLAPKVAPKTEPLSPDKPAQKSQKLPSALGKAGLGTKVTASSEKAQKQKGPGEGETTAPVSTDKQPEVVTAPVVVQASGSTAQNVGSTAPPGVRHPGGLAIDVGKLRKKDGTWITVLAHFHGKIGEKACGVDAPVPTVTEAKELRALVCGAMDQHIFTYVLTPNYNAAHRDHFHMEIKPGVKWFMVH